MKKMLELIETRQGCAILENESRYHVMLHGQKVSELHFNMRGYVGALPTPEGRSLDIGEVSISKWKREAAALNRQFQLAATAETQQRKDDAEN
jgi:hypothetical protein